MDIQQLCDRYHIASKKTLYRRLNGIGLELSKKNGKVSASKKEVELLDQLDDHIANGNPVSTFVPLSPSEVVSADVSSSGHTETQLETVSSSGHTETQLNLAPEIINLITQTLATNDPLLPQKRLELAATNGWELSTSQITNIIGSKPRIKKGEDCYCRGSFLFYKVGKMGNELAWIVKRKNERFTEGTTEID